MNIYQHFRPEEKGFIDQVLNWKNFVEKTFTSKLTDFLDPREQHILKMVIGTQTDLKVEFFGGSQNSERKRALLMPGYETADQTDFQISLIEAEYPNKFYTIEHPQVLGTLMALGVQRGKFGDILIKEKRVQFFACEEISDYLLLNVQSIGKAAVHLAKIELESALVSDTDWSEENITVSSLRLDTVLSGIHHLSRQKSQTLIQHGLVKVNWSLTENPSFECQEGDMISARGYGRMKILTIDGKTKKEKWRIIAGKQK
jgi:RNA-binding protein YlmH